MIIESWFIPIDILKIICAVLAIALGLLCLILIIGERTCHTVPMMLVANSYFSQLLYAVDVLTISVFTLNNDLRQQEFSDVICTMAGAVSYSVTMIQMYSYLLQAAYRYLVVVHPNRLIWRSARLQAGLICLTWLCGSVYLVPLLVTNQIVYLANDQICQMPLRFSPLTIFNALYIYIFPLGAIMGIYLKMILYVKAMGKRITPMNILFRARRELRMIHRIVSIVLFLVLLGVPYVIFILMSFFDRAPKYHFRIAYVFIVVSLVFMMLALFQISEPLKSTAMKKVKRTPVRIGPTTITQTRKTREGRDSAGLSLRVF